MGEVNGDFDGVLNGDDEQDRVVHEWEEGLPDVDDITPLNHALIPQSLLLAFNIKLDPSRTHGDVIRASEDTLSSIRAQSSGPNSAEGSESKKLRRDESPENAAAPAEEEKSLKRQRLVWTPQLHRRFVDVVGHLGIKNAVPKTIMQLMNVEGLTRENVASHLQKYRLYLKRMQRGTSPETSSPVPEISPEIGGASFPVPYGGTPMVPVMGSYNGFQYNYHNQYNGVMQTGNKFGSVVGYHHHNPPHVTPGDR